MSSVGKTVTNGSNDNNSELSVGGQCVTEKLQTVVNGGGVKKTPTTVESQPDVLNLTTRSSVASVDVSQVTPVETSGVDVEMKPEPEIKPDPDSSVLQPIAVDTSITEKVATNSAVTDLASPIKKPRLSGPVSAPIQGSSGNGNVSMAVGRPRRQRTQPKHLDDLEIDVPSPESKIPSQKTPTGRVGKKSPAVTTPKPPTPKDVLFEKDDFCTVRCDGEKFYLCKLLANVQLSSRAMIQIRWLELDKTPNEYVWSFNDKIDKASILTNVNVDHMGKDRISLPNAEIMRSMYVLKKSLLSESGEHVTLELPPELSKFMPAPISTANNGPTAAAKKPASSPTRATAPPKHPRRGGLSIVLPDSEEESDEDEEEDRNDVYLPSRGRPRKNPPIRPPSLEASGAGRPRGRPPSKNSSPMLNGEEHGSFWKKSNDDDYLPSNKRRKSLKTPKTPSPAPVISPASKSAGVVPKNREVNFANRVKISSNDHFTDSSFKFEKPSPSFKGKQVIRAVLFNNMEELKSLVVDTDVETLNVPRSKDVQITALESAAMSGSLEALKLICDDLLDSKSSVKRRTYRSMLGPVFSPVSRDLSSKELSMSLLNADASSDTSDIFVSRFLERVLTFGIPSSTLEFLIPKFGNDVVSNRLRTSLRHGNLENSHKLLKLIKDSDVPQTCLEGLTKFEPDVAAKWTAESLRMPLPINGRLTAVHCACINPDSTVLNKMLEISPESVSLCDGDNYSPVHYAASCTSSSALEMLIKREVDVTFIVTSDGLTPLIVASKTNKPKNIDLILNHPKVKGNEDALVSFISVNGGKNAIHFASELGCYESLARLVNCTTAVDQPLDNSCEGLTALMLAASGGHFDCCELLLKHGAQVNIRDLHGRTALVHAVTNGHYNVTTLLIAHNANPLISDCTDNSLLHYACAYGWSPCVDLLLELDLPRNSFNAGSLTPFMVAILKHHVEIARTILASKDVDVNSKDSCGQTILHKVCKAGKYSSSLYLVKFLFKELQASCKLHDIDGNSALHILASTELLSDEEKLASVDVGKSLLENGCDPNAVNNNHKLPFLAALQSGNFPLCKYLAETTKSFFISHMENDNGQTALHLLLQSGCYPDTDALLKLMVAKLNDNSNDFANSRSDNGRTPLIELLLAMLDQKSQKNVDAGLNTLKTFLAKFSRVDGNLDSLSVKDSVIQSPLHLAVKLSAAFPSLSTEVVKLVVGKKADVNKVLDGRSSLHLAIELGCSVQLIEFLLTSGANLNLTTTFNVTKDGKKLVSLYTPLMLAAQRENLDLLTLLLAKNAQTDLLDSVFRQPVLHHAVKSITSISGIHCLEKLLPKMYKTDVQDSSLRTALHLAVSLDSVYVPDACSLLIKAGCSPKWQDSNGRTPIHELFYQQNFGNSSSFDPVDAFTVFQTTCPESLSLIDQSGCSVMHYAAARGATMCCSIMQDLKLDAKVADKNGNIPLVHAVMFNREECAISLLKYLVAHVDLKKVNAFIPRTLKNVDSPLLTEQVLKEVSIFSYMVHQGLLSALVSLSIQAMKRSGDCTNSFLLTEFIKSGHLGKAATFLHKMYLETLMLNDLNQNHFHDLALTTLPITGDLKQLVSLLVSKGVKVLTPDKPNFVLALHYAAFSGNITYLEALCEHSEVETVSFAKDSFDRTIFCAGLMSGSLETIRFCLEKLTKPKLADSITKFGPLYNDTVSLYNSYNISATVSVTPLIFAIQKLSFEIVQILVQSGKFDVNKCDEQQKTPIMYAIESGDLRKVLVLINSAIDLSSLRKNTNNHNLPQSGHFSYLGSSSKLSSDFANFPRLSTVLSQISLSELKNTNKVDFTSVDALGNTLSHYSVNSSENVEIVELLKLFSVNFDAKNNDGDHALKVAVRNGYYKLAEVLASYSSERLVFAKCPSLSVVSKQKGQVPAFQEDCVDIWNGLKAGLRLDREEFVFEIDEKCSAGRKPEIVIDSTLQIPLDARMVKSEVGSESGEGCEVSFSFYKMQLINAKSKNLFILFTNWGTVGQQGNGQFQNIPFQSLEQAKKEFARLFKNKTDNNWETSKEKFQARPRKFTVLRNDYFRKCKKIKPASVDLSSSIDLNLDICVYVLLSDLATELSISLDTFSNIDSCFSNKTVHVGSTSPQLIESLENLLRSIRALTSDIAKESVSLSPNHSKIINNYQTLMSFSNELYYCLPVDFDPCLSNVLYTPDDLNNVSRLVLAVKNLHFTSKVLFAALKRNNEIHPINYIQLSINCYLEKLSYGDEVVKEIIRCVRVSNRDSVISNIFSIDKSDEKEKLESGTIFTNHVLLWYPLSPGTVLGTLGQGLGVIPQSFGTKNLIRDSVLFTDIFLRVFDEATVVNGNKYLLLCQVALGETLSPGSQWDGTLPGNINSIHLQSPLINRVADRTLPGGVRTRAATCALGSNGQSQYSVFNLRQARLAYLVQLNADSIP